MLRLWNRFIQNQNIMARLFVFGREDKDNKWYTWDKPYAYFTYKSFLARWQVIATYDSWFVSKAKPAWSYMEDHIILRPRERGSKQILSPTDMSTVMRSDLVLIYDYYNSIGYHTFVNPYEYRSVKKYHVHLCKCKVLEKIK